MVGVIFMHWLCCGWPGLGTLHILKLMKRLIEARARARDQTGSGRVRSGEPHAEGKLGWIHACQSETSPNESKFSLRGLVTQDESTLAVSFHVVPAEPHFAGCTSQNS